MPKVLHITQATVGGTLEYLKLMLPRLKSKGYDVEVVCPAYGPMANELGEMGFKVTIVDMTREISLVKDFISYLSIRKYIRASNPDVVHLHSSKAGVLGKIASYTSSKPCIYNPHGWSFSMDISELKKNVYALIEKITSIFANYVINISENEFRLAKKYHIVPLEKMRLIYNGIDIDKYTRISLEETSRIKEALGIPQNALVLGMVGRLTEQKDPLTYIEICKSISEMNDNIFFLLVGDGELREKVEVKAKEYSIKDKLIITGWKKNVASYISVFDIAVLTSKWEGFGLVLAEYMASRKPVVASDVGGIPELINDGINGDLVKPKDVKGFVDTINKLINNKELQRKYVSNGFDIVSSKFNIDRVINEHIQLYDELVQKKHK